MSQLDLAFARDGDGRTRLARRRVRYPWSLTRPFWIDHAPKGMASVIPQSTSSIILAEDRVEHSLSVGQGAAAHLTSQGAQAVHANRTDAPTEITWRLDCGPGAVLEVLTDPIVLFDEAWMRQTVEVTLPEDAFLILAEGFTWHGAAANPGFRQLESRLTARRPDGRLLVRERNRVEPATLALATPGPSPAALGQVWVFARPSNRLASALEELRGDEPGLYAGCSRLPDDAGFLLRSAAEDRGALPRFQRAVWRRLREVAFGHAPPDRRRGP